MFITAIVIVILFVVFYFIVKKNHAYYEQQWKEVGNIEEKILVSGTLKRHFVEKKKFYQHRYIWRMKLFVVTRNQTITVIYEQPAISKEQPFQLQPNSKIQCYGQWNQQFFIANRVELQK